MQGRRYLSFLCVVALCLVAASAIAQTYTAIPLPPPSGYYFLNLMNSMNNKGQVLGEAGNIPNGIRFPVLWTNAVPLRIPIPKGYSYFPNPLYWKVNDNGVVIGIVSDANSSHIALWPGYGGAASVVLPDAPVNVICGNNCSCSGPSASIPFSINRAGHILGWTIYPYGSCYGFWVYNNGTYRRLPDPVPAQCSPTSVYTDNGYAAMNDADQVVVNVGNINCPYFPFYPDSVAAIIQPDGSYSFIPEGNSVFLADSINNSSLITGCLNCGTPGGVGVWDSVAGLRYLGDDTAGGAPNNTGQVVYSTYFGAWNLQIWQNGTSNPVQGQNLPNAPSVAFNDAAQIAVNGGQTFGGWLLTPAGPCAIDVISQVSVAFGAFQYDSSTGHYTQLVTVQNISSNTITGPLSVALKNLIAAASLFNTDGATSCSNPVGSEYTNFPVTSLAPGASTSVTLEFIDTANANIIYRSQILAGAGIR